MKDFRCRNIALGLNYGTIETKEKDVIYIETVGEYAGDGAIIAVTVEEAEMIASKLMDFVELFK